MLNIQPFYQIKCLRTTIKYFTNTDKFTLIMTHLKQTVLRSQQIELKLIKSINNELKDGNINPNKMRIQMNKIAPIVSIHEEMQDLLKDIDYYQESKINANTEEMEFIQQQLQQLNSKKKCLETESIKLLITPQPYDDVDQIYLELRAGAGGSQSSIFVEDISYMFKAYCQAQSWHISTVSSIKQNNNNIGFKSLKFKVKGTNAYKIMKCQAGIHKVIRVPQTESKGRIHSSTISLAVMPQIPFNFEIQSKDIKYQFCRSSGPGGQSVNKTDSACRATHLPSGLSVFIQQSKSQDGNKKRATEILKQKIFEIQYSQTMEKLSLNRKEQIGTMDRSEKIRTYNYPQNRITDHRTGLTLFGIEQMMSGNLLTEFIESYMNQEYQRKLSSVLNQLQNQSKQNMEQL